MYISYNVRQATCFFKSITRLGYTHAIDVAKDCAGSRVKLKLDGGVALSVHVGTFEGVDVEEVTTATVRAEKAFQCSGKLVCR